MDQFDDIVLRYNLQLKQFKKEVVFSRKLYDKEREYEEVSEREYNHESFGFYRDDDILARNHFFMQIRTLADHASDERLLLTVACEDLEKYVLGCKYGNSDSQNMRLDAERMIYLILAYGGAEPLYLMVKRLYNETLEDYNEPDVGQVDSNFFLDFYDLYQQYGDYVLYIEKDVNTALKYYELASLDWYYFEGGIEWDVSRQKKKEVLNRVTEFDWLIHLVRSPGKKFQYWKKQVVWPKEEHYKEIFISYIYNLEKADKQKICMNAAVFFHAMDRMIMQNCTRHEIRLPLLLAHGIRETSLEYMLYIIREKGRTDAFDETMKKNIFHCLRSNHSKKLTPIYDYVNQTEEADQKLEDCFDMLAVMEHVERIISLLRMKTMPDVELAYYTSLETFSYMLPFKAREGMIGKFSVMNIAYMNDPNEGRTLQKWLFSGDIPFEGDPKHRKDARYPYVFIKCFTPQIDFLPMWEMYGDHARGCCLVIDWNRCRDRGMEVPLYNVCYLSKVGTDYKVEQQYNVNLEDCMELEQALNSLSVLCRRLYGVNEACLEAVHSILNEILYLFKDASYSYEKEVRICYQYLEVDSVFRHTPGNFGKLYVATEFPAEIKEVILGPKFMNRSDVMPYLQEQIDLMCEECNLRSPKITLSDIEYRQDLDVAVILDRNQQPTEE